MEMMESKSILKFGPKVREIDRQYEINNNADLDNGVYNQVKENGLSDEDLPKQSSLKSSRVAE